MLKTGMIIAERYEIVSKIGTGGMADVYKAMDHKLNRFVAVKVLKPEFREDATFVKKFRSEAQAAAGLTHPNIVNVFDVGDDEGVYYIVMELIEGITLKEYISKKGKLSVKEATSIAIQVSMGLEAAHSHGIVHRDVNLLCNHLRKRRTVKSKVKIGLAFVFYCYQNLFLLYDICLISQTGDTICSILLFCLNYSVKFTFQFQINLPTGY